MNKIAIGIVGGVVGLAGFVGYLMRRKSYSKVHLWLSFDEKEQNKEKMFIRIWKDNAKHFSRMAISNDDRYGFERRKIRKYNFDVDSYGFSLLEDFVIHF